MPRFYFDVRHGENFTPDSEGLDLPSVEQARQDESRSLSEMVEDALPDGQHLAMAIEVRGEDKSPLFKVQITFAVEAPEGR